MPRRLPPLNALRAFEAAGRHRSFTGAADELNVTHAAISRHIRGLEQRLGVQLFSVVARGVELTEAGSQYLQSVTPAFDQIALATEELTSAQVGVVSISCEPTFAVKWLMPHLGDFKANHPGIDIRIDATPKLADLERHECDVAIRFFSGEATRFECDLISRSPVYPVGSPRLEQPDTLQGLLGLGLLHEDRGSLWCRWFAAAGIENVALPPVSARLATLLAIEGALAGQGLALLSAELVDDDIRKGRLRRFWNVGLDYGGYYLCYLTETGRRATFKAFQAWLLAATETLRSGQDQRDAS